MRKLSQLHESFIAHHTQTSLPVQPTSREEPVIATERWVTVKNVARKTYRFRTLEQRNRFVAEMLVHETEFAYEALYDVRGDKVRVTLNPEGCATIAKLDRDIASYADALFKDVSYGYKHAKENEFRELAEPTDVSYQ